MLTFRRMSRLSEQDPADWDDEEFSWAADDSMHVVDFCSEEEEETEEEEDESEASDSTSRVPWHSR